MLLFLHNGLLGFFEVEFSASSGLSFDERIQEFRVPFKELRGSSLGRWAPFSSSDCLVFPISGKGFLLVSSELVERASARGSSEVKIKRKYFSFARFGKRFFFPQAVEDPFHPGEVLLAFIEGKDRKEVSFYRISPRWGKSFDLKIYGKFSVKLPEAVMFFRARDGKILLVFEDSAVVLSLKEFLKNRSAFVAASSVAHVASPPLYWFEGDAIFVPRGFLLKGEKNAGTTMWEVRTAGRLIFPPSFPGDEVEFFSGDRALFFHDETGYLGAVSLYGELLWAARWFPSASSPVVLSDGVLFAGKAVRAGGSFATRLLFVGNDGSLSFGWLNSSPLVYYLPVVLSDGNGREYVIFACEDGLYSVYKKDSPAPGGTLVVERVLSFNGSLSPHDVPDVDYTHDVREYAFLFVDGDCEAGFEKSCLMGCRRHEFMFHYRMEVSSSRSVAPSGEVIYDDYASFAWNRSISSQGEKCCGEGGKLFALSDAYGVLTFDEKLVPHWFYGGGAFYPPVVLETPGRGTSKLLIPHKGGFVIFSESGEKLKFVSVDSVVLPVGVDFIPSFGFFFKSVLGVRGKEMGYFIGYDGKRVSLYTSLGKPVWSVEAPDLMLIPSIVEASTGGASKGFFLLCVYKSALKLFYTPELRESPKEVFSAQLPAVMKFAFHDGGRYFLYDGHSLYVLDLRGFAGIAKRKRRGEINLELFGEIGSFAPLKGLIRSGVPYWAFYAEGRLYKNFPFEFVRKNGEKEALSSYGEKVPRGSRVVVWGDEVVKLGKGRQFLILDLSSHRRIYVTPEGVEDTLGATVRARGLRYFLELR